MLEDRSVSESVSSKGYYHLGVKAEVQDFEQAEGSSSGEESSNKSKKQKCKEKRERK